MGAIREYGKHRKWTAEEISLLKSLIEKYPDPVIARKLGRTFSSVKSKRISLGISRFTDQTDKLTLNQVAELVGVSKSNIGKTWVPNGLKCKKTGRLVLVAESALIAFMQKNPRLWKASKCDYYFFCKYPWFKERLHQERAGTDEAGNKNYRSWSGRELSRMKMLKRKGLTHRQIGAELGRSKRAVDKMVMRTKERNDKERIWS